MKMTAPSRVFIAFEHRETTTPPLLQPRQFPCLNNNVIIWLTEHNLLLKSASARCARCFVWPCSDRRRWRNTDVISESPRHLPYSSTTVNHAALLLSLSLSLFESVCLSVYLPSYPLFLCVVWQMTMMSVVCLLAVLLRQIRLQSAGAYLEGGPRGPRPPNRNFFWLRLSTYSLTWFLPNHVYNLCRIAW